MRANLLRRANRQLAVFVGGGPESLAIVEPVLDGQAYDVEFVASDDEPYATVAALKPDLVVVSLGMEQIDGFQLLTMLRLDPETAAIPVLSFVRDEEVTGLGLTNVDPNPARLALSTASRASRH